MMDNILSQIHTLSTRNDSDLKRLKDFLRHEQEFLKVNARHIDQALQALDMTQNTLGIAFLLAARLSAQEGRGQAAFGYITSFLLAADEQQVKKASVPINTVCKVYAQMAIDEGQQAMMRSLRPLRCALEKLRPNAETLTPVHAELLRVCLKAKAYHFGARVLEQPIFDIALSSNSCTQMTPQCFLCFFYYGALIRIGLKEYSQALQLLLVVLTCPASCLSAIQADAYKKYVLVSLKANGELPTLPVYASHIVLRYAKSPSYALEIAEAFKAGDAAAVQRTVQAKQQQIQADNNEGLVNQVIASMQRHKIQTLTKTYLTLSLAEIASEVGYHASEVSKVEELLFDMISSSEINARIDQSTGNVSFEEDDDEMDVRMVGKIQDKLSQILEVAGRISAFEQEVVCSEAYIRKTAVMEGDRPTTIPSNSSYAVMDM